MHDCRVVVTAGRFGPAHGKGGGDPQRVLTGPARNARNSAGRCRAGIDPTPHRQQDVPPDQSPDAGVRDTSGGKFAGGQDAG
jgi:hypothetical protein